MLLARGISCRALFHRTGENSNGQPVPGAPLLTPFEKWPPRQPALWILPRFDSTLMWPPASRHCGNSEVGQPPVVRIIGIPGKSILTFFITPSQCPPSQTEQPAGCDNNLQPAKPDSQYSLINSVVQQVRAGPRRRSTPLPKTAPKREFRPKIELKSLFQEYLQVSP